MPIRTCIRDIERGLHCETIAMPGNLYCEAHAREAGWRPPYEPTWKPKIMVVGHARHGKDTVGELMRDELGLSFQSSSMFAAERVMMPAFNEERMVENKYRTALECYEDRVNHRKFWFDEICRYNTPDCSRLGRELLQQYDVYCGIRSFREFFALKNQGLFDASIWVDASKRVEPEPGSSNEMQPWMCDFFLDNNGPVEELKTNLRHIMRHIMERKARP